MTVISGSGSPDRIMSKRQVADLLGVDPSTVARWSDAGTLPPKVRLGQHRVGWHSSTIEAWLAER